MRVYFAQTITMFLIFVAKASVFALNRLHSIDEKFVEILYEGDAFLAPISKATSTIHTVAFCYVTNTRFYACFLRLAEKPSMAKPAKNMA